MDPVLRDRVNALQEKGQQLQKQNKYKQALDIYEQLLDINRNAYGLHSQQHQRISIKLCQLCNLISMILLQKQKFDVCLLFLKKAQSYCLKLPKQTAVTYNNYACHYRKIGKHRTALMYLQSALELEWKTGKSDSLADTYLNLCAVLSQLGRHSQGLENVLFSITMLQQQVFMGEASNQQRIPVLAIAYHNMAVQLEYLKRYEQSIATYQKAVIFSRNRLGQGHSLTQNLENVLHNAQQGRQANQKKTINRRKGGDHERVDNMKRTYKQPRPLTGYKSKKGI